MVPDGWQRLKAKEVFCSVSEKNHPTEELLSATQDMGVLPRSMLPARVTMPTKNLESFKLVEQGNFIISLRSFQGGIEHSKYRGIVSPAYTVLTNKISISSDFFRHYFKTHKFIKDLDSSVIGIRDGKQISYKSFAEIDLLVPPLPEQKKIAAILGSVDEAIQATQAVIDQTRKVKQGLLQQLLTRGIGHTRFKQTEIGEIPEGWEVVQLEVIATVERGKFSPRPRNDPQYYGGDIPFVQTGDIARAKGYLNEYTQTLNEKGLKVSKLFPIDTILITIAANIGDVARTIFEVACPDSLVGVVAKKGVNPAWLFYQLQTQKDYLESQATQNAQKNINLQVLKPMLIPLPPREEQGELADILLGFDEKMTVEGKSLSKLHTLKRGLMQDLLTGRVRVRVKV